MLFRFVTWLWITVLCGLIALILYGAMYWDFWNRSGSDEDTTLPRTAIVVTGNSQRIQFALEQMALGKFDRLLVAGAGLDGSRFSQHFSLTTSLQQAFERGDIVLSDRSTSTLENAIEAACWLMENPSISEFSLITSQYHMGRTSLAFERALSPQYRIVRLASDALKNGRRPALHKTEWHKFLATWLITLAPQSLWVTGSIKPCTDRG